MLIPSLVLRKKRRPKPPPRSLVLRHRNQITDDRPIHQLVRLTVFVAGNVAEDQADDRRPNSKTVEGLCAPSDNLLRKRLLLRSYRLDGLLSRGDARPLISGPRCGKPPFPLLLDFLDPCLLLGDQLDLERRRRMPQASDLLGGVEIVGSWIGAEPGSACPGHRQLQPKNMIFKPVPQRLRSVR